jgi:hypothetical protein
MTNEYFFSVSFLKKRVFPLNKNDNIFSHNGPLSKKGLLNENLEPM